MRFHGLLLWISAIIVGAFVLGVLAAKTVSGSWTARWLGGPPRISLPAELSWEEAEVWSKVAAPVTIRNDGGQDLLIDNIRSTCGCSGLEREHDGRVEPVQSLRIRPGEEVGCMVRFEARGVPEQAIRHRVMLRTNDPNQPEVGLMLVVHRLTGGVSGVPSSISFGEVRLGQEEFEFVDIVDGAPSPRRLARVTSSDPSRFSVLLLATDHRVCLIDGQPAGTVIGRVKVGFVGSQPGWHQGTIEVHLEGVDRPPSTIPVTVRVKRPVEVSPSLLVLKRHPAQEAERSIALTCSSTEDKPLSVSITETPPGVRAKVVPEIGPPSKCVVEVAWASDTVPTKSASLLVLRLRAEVDGTIHDLEVPVRILEE